MSTKQKVRDNDDDCIRPHPCYLKLVQECLEALDQLTPEEQETVLLFLRVRVSQYHRKWRVRLVAVEPKVLGRNA